MVENAGFAPVIIPDFMIRSLTNYQAAMIPKLINNIHTLGLERIYLDAGAHRGSERYPAQIRALGASWFRLLDSSHQRRQVLA